MPDPATTIRRRERDGAFQGIAVDYLLDTLAPIGDATPAAIETAISNAYTDPLQLLAYIRRMDRDAVYMRSIATRIAAVSGLTPQVVPASEDARDQAVAEAVTEDLVPVAMDLSEPLLLATSTGVSVVEVAWDPPMAGKPRWCPREWRLIDPQWIREDVRGLYVCNSVGQEMARVMPGTGTWLSHRGGRQIGPALLSGAAPACLLPWATKRAALLRWAAFIVTFGYPLIVGRYDQHTKADVAVLRRALTLLGRDTRVTMPKGMEVEVLNAAATTGGSSSYFNDLTERSNKEMEIAVLGQTATTEGTPGRLGADNAQDRVRRDISVSDAARLSDTATIQLSRPYTTLGWGPDTPAPRIEWVVPEPPLDLRAWVQGIDRMLARGLAVTAADVRNRLRLSVPEDGEEVLEMTAPARPPLPMPGAAAMRAAIRRRLAAAA